MHTTAVTAKTSLLRQWWLRCLFHRQCWWWRWQWSQRWQQWRSSQWWWARGAGKMRGGSTKGETISGWRWQCWWHYWRWQWQRRKWRHRQLCTADNCNDDGDTSVGIAVTKTLQYQYHWQPINECWRAISVRWGKVGGCAALIILFETTIIAIVYLMRFVSLITVDPM